MRRFLVMAGLLLAVHSSAATPLERPPSGYVSDFANTLTDEARGGLTQRLAALKAETGIEMAVVTLASLGETSVEAYAERLFREWGIGEKGKDNGILVLIVPSAGVMRIEVGYGLESVVPDGLAGEVIRQDFTPSFRQGNFGEGVEKGVGRLIAILHQGEALPEDWKPAGQDRDSNPDFPLLVMLPFFALFVGLGFFALGAGVQRRDSFLLMWGGSFGGIPLLMSFLFLEHARPALPYRQVVLPVFALLMLVLGALAHRTRLYDWLAKLSRGGGGSGGSSTGGWSSRGGGSSGGSSSGGSSSSGSFGGGSSGGGGATGRW